MLLLPTSLSLYVLTALNAFSHSADAQAFDPASLVGTWTSKSAKVLTGPGFYDPINEVMFEPNLTGISYSFTADGYYEEALYRAISNPTTPSCTSAILQWQHGTYTIGLNTTLNVPNLSLTPISVDGRSILSAPCTSKTTELMRYNQTEFFSEVQLAIDPYNQQWRLNLFQWDGTPVNPMWLAMTPPQMLPTQTLNPTVSATGTGAAATGTATQTGTVKVKRAFGAGQVGAKAGVVGGKSAWLEGNTWFWVGMIMTAMGSVVVAFS